MKPNEESLNSSSVVSFDDSSKQQPKANIPDVADVPDLILEVIRSAQELQKHEAKMRLALQSMLAAVDQLAEVA